MKVKKTHLGRCQCGAVRLTVKRDILISYICHCHECQKQSASAFAISVPLKVSEVSFSGQLNSYKRAAASGAITHCYFCPNCGTRIYHQSSSSRNSLTLKGGILDNSQHLDPVAHLWVSRKHGWVELPEGIESYAEQPDDLKSWRRKLLQ